MLNVTLDFLSGILGSLCLQVYFAACRPASAVHRTPGRKEGWEFIVLFQLFRKEAMDASQVSLSKLKEFQSLFLDLQLLEASKPCICERGKEGRRNTYDC